MPIADIIAHFESAFAKQWHHPQGEIRNGEDFTISWDGVAGAAFQLSFTAVSFRVDCYGVKNKDLNRMVDIGRHFQCPLYDPQVGKRFDE